MIGRRVPDATDHYEPGDYGRIGRTWYAMAPNGLLANLGKHDVVEHDDNTLTVSPSILVRSASERERWHGYLERGVWREA